MSDIGGGNSAFDVRFFEIESVGAIFIVGVLVALLGWRALGRGLPRWPAALLVIVAIVLGPAIAVYWQTAYPSANGIEGAGRFVFGGAATLGNALFAGLGAFALLERRARWVALTPAAMVILFWVTFLMT